MKVNYTVHSLGNDQIDAPVEYRGARITAKVPMVTVELVSDDPTQSNPVLRIRPESEAELASWAIGTRIVGTFEPEISDGEPSQ